MVFHPSMHFTYQTQFCSSNHSNNKIIQSSLNNQKLIKSTTEINPKFAGLGGVLRSFQENRILYPIKEWIYNNLLESESGNPRSEAGEEVYGCGFISFSPKLTKAFIQ